MEIKIRSWTKQDRYFVYSTFKKQLYRSKLNDYRFMEKSDYESYMNHLLDSKLDKLNVDIVCPVDAEFQILGYIIYSLLHDCLVYVYVKSIYRRNGLFNKMANDSFKGPPVFYSFRTSDKTWRKYTKDYAVKYLPIEFL